MRVRSKETRDQTIKLSRWTREEWFNQLSSSISVTDQSALSIPAFSNAVRVLSQTVATLPAHIYQRKNDSREKAKYHYLYDLIHMKPNNYMTAFEYWEYVIRDVIFGNHYSLIEREKGGYHDILALHPLTRGRVLKFWSPEKKEFLYKYDKDGETTYYRQSEIWHLKNAGNGITGDNIVDLFHDTIKQALTIEAFTSLYFDQGPNSPIILETPEGTEAPNTDAISAIKKLWREINKQKDKHIPNVMPGGLTIKELKHMNLSESQLIELKTYVVQQIARMFSLPPHIIADLSKSSFNNIQEQNRNILTYAVNPYLHRIEKSINAFLLHEYERDEYYCEFSREALLEANPVEKSEQVKNLVTSGIMSINQGKSIYNLPEVPGGDTTMVLNQMTTIENVLKGANLNGKKKDE